MEDYVDKMFEDMKPLKRKIRALKRAGILTLKIAH
jgi:hypothetical protein